MKFSILRPTSGMRTSTVARNASRACRSDGASLASPFSATGACWMELVTVASAVSPHRPVQVSARRMQRSPRWELVDDRGQPVGTQQHPGGDHVDATVVAQPEHVENRLVRSGFGQPCLPVALVAEGVGTCATVPWYSVAMSNERGIGREATVTGRGWRAGFRGCAGRFRRAAGAADHTRVGPSRGESSPVSIPNRSSRRWRRWTGPVCGHWCSAAGPTSWFPDDLTDLTVVRLANSTVTADGAVLRVEAGRLGRRRRPGSQ